MAVCGGDKMNAKKCDRCGCYYNQYPGRDYGASKTNMIALQNDYMGGSTSHFDLCPACMDKQIQFLSGTELTSGENK